MTKIPNKLLATLALGLGVLVGCTAASAQEDPQTAPDPLPQQALPPEAQEERDDQPSPGAADEGAVELLHSIEAATADMLTLRTRVRYTRTQGLTGDQQRRFGDFYYAAQTDEQPTRFAVLFDRLLVDGNAREMESWFVFDGNWLLERDHDDMTATRRELVPAGAEREGELDLGDGGMPIPLRMQADKILQRFSVQRLEDEALGNGRVNAHLRLTPLDPQQGDDPMDLWFDTQTLLLHRVTTTQDGDEVEMLFSLQAANAEIAAEVFSTALPGSDDWQTQEVPLQ